MNLKILREISVRLSSSYGQLNFFERSVVHKSVSLFNSNVTSNLSAPILAVKLWWWGWNLRSTHPPVGKSMKAMIVHNIP